LSRIGQNFNCANGTGSCSDASRRVDIEIYCSEIVHCLLTAAYLCVPQIPASAQKHQWSPILDDLKQDAIDAHNMWTAAGRTRSGDVFNHKKNTKYKLAIKDAAMQLEGRFDVELLSKVNGLGNNYT